MGSYVLCVLWQSTFKWPRGHALHCKDGGEGLVKGQPDDLGDMHLCMEPDGMGDDEPMLENIPRWLDRSRDG